MKKILYTFALLLTATPALMARQLTSDEAAANAAAYMSKGVRKAPALSNASALKLVQTMRAADGQPTLYLFSAADGQGLLVAPAESECAPVLGYADSGKFDPANIPANMQGWLEGYSQEIQMLAAGDYVTVPVRKAAAEYAAIEPITKTLWNQNSPYNDLCPQYNGSPSVTGCVATAMAQAMKVHEWPAQGRGTATASCNGQSLSLDLSGSTYDWADMLNTYTATATDAEKQAVATLMRDCGYSVKMQYTSTESGTAAAYIPGALVTNFDYDQGVHNLFREYYTLTDWEQIVYDELKAGRPVIYAGVSPAEGGHCFVCDGYSSDRYYHINWGWGGMSDGYFRLSALSPEIQGIGGSTGGFNTDQSIVVGMQKPQAGSQYYLQVLSNGAFSTYQEEYSTGASVAFLSPAFINRSIVSISGYFGAKLTDSEGNVTYVQGSRPVTLQPDYYLTTYSVSGSLFPTEGTYTVTPAFLSSSDNQWIDIPVRLDYANSLQLTCADGMLSFVSTPVSADIQVNDVTLESEMYSDTKFDVSATVVNTGTSEYLGTVTGVLLDSNYNLIAQAADAAVDIEGGDSMELSYMSQFKSTPADGTYYFAFVNTAGNIVSTPIEVNITSAPAGQVVLLPSNLRITSGDGGTPVTVPYDDIVFEGTITCESGYFAGDVSAYIFPARGGSSLASAGSVTCFLNAGESKDFTLKTSFANGHVGTRYMIAMFNGDTELQGYVNFILGAPTTGVQEIVSQPQQVSAKVQGDMLVISGCEGISAVTVYELNGSKALSGTGTQLDVTDLPSGYYIAVIGTTEGNCVAKFLR